MEDIEKIKVSKDTQKFVSDLADLPLEKYHKVRDILNDLKGQQAVEANLEKQRGWRYMWQRTPKPYLLMLGYLVFLAPVGSVGYHALSYISDDIKIIYLIIFASIMILPLAVVFYLSYQYIKKRIKDVEEK